MQSLGSFSGEIVQNTAAHELLSDSTLLHISAGLLRAFSAPRLIASVKENTVMRKMQAASGSVPVQEGTGTQGTWTPSSRDGLPAAGKLAAHDMK